MRKIIEDIKAGAVPIIAILIVTIIVVAGIVIYLNPDIIGSKEYWETETGFGIWEDEIIIKYVDGTTVSLKMLQDSSPLTVTHEGKEVSEILMRLRAKVTGTGYDGAEIQANAVGYSITIGSESSGFQSNTATYNVPVGSTQQLAYIEISSAVIERYNVPDGSATIEFIPGGSVEYRGYPDGGDWQTASLPPTRSVPIIISRTPTGSITVTLSSEL